MPDIVSAANTGACSESGTHPSRHYRPPMIAVPIPVSFRGSQSSGAARRRKSPSWRRPLEFDEHPRGIDVAQPDQSIKSSVRGRLRGSFCQPVARRTSNEPDPRQASELLKIGKAVKVISPPTMVEISPNRAGPGADRMLCEHLAPANQPQPPGRWRHIVAGDNRSVCARRLPNSERESSKRINWRGQSSGSGARYPSVQFARCRPARRSYGALPFRRMLVKSCDMLSEALPFLQCLSRLYRGTCLWSNRVYR